MSNWTLDVKENDDGEAYIELNEEILEASGFKEGDSIKWVDNLDGSFTLLKSEMAGYKLTDEFENPNMYRKAKVYVGENEFIVDMIEGPNLIGSRKLTDCSKQYAEDCAENWVFAYGEFAK